MIMKCSQCGNPMKEIKVKFSDSALQVKAFSCKPCRKFGFEENSLNRALAEARRRNPLKKREQEKVISKIAFMGKGKTLKVRVESKE